MSISEIQARIDQLTSTWEQFKALNEHRLKKEITSFEITDFDKLPRYNCRLKAACMAKAFGVRYGLKKNSKISWDCMDSIEDILKILSQYDGYIHPESKYIFKPQIGDLIIGWADRIGWVSEINEFEGTITIDVDGGEWTCPMRENETEIYYKILERNNETFLWPIGEMETTWGNSSVG